MSRDQRGGGDQIVFFHSFRSQEEWRRKRRRFMSLLCELCALSGILSVQVKSQCATLYICLVICCHGDESFQSHFWLKDRHVSSAPDLMCGGGGGGGGGGGVNSQWQEVSSRGEGASDPSVELKRTIKFQRSRRLPNQLLTGRKKEARSSHSFSGWFICIYIYIYICIIYICSGSVKVAPGLIGACGRFKCNLKLVV